MDDPNKCKDGKLHDLMKMKKQDKDMLRGYMPYQKCKKCGMESYPIAINIATILRQMKSTLDWMNIEPEDRKFTPELLSELSDMEFPYITKENFDYDKDGKETFTLKANKCKFFTNKLTIKQAKELLNNKDKCI